MINRFLNSNKNKNTDKESTPLISGTTMKKQKCRKYDNCYLEFGFTCYNVCMKVLAPKCIIQMKLKRQLETNHHYMVVEPHNFFARKLKFLWYLNYTEKKLV